MLDAILAVPLGLLLLFGVFWFFGNVAKLFTVDLYRHHRYTRNGICYKCKQPFQAVEVRAVDQTYGPTQVQYPVCSCGSKPLPVGLRRGADWAGF